MDKQATEPASPTLGGIGWVFTRYANLTLGGGGATTSVLHHELLEKRHWLDNDRFILCYALGRLTPGTNVLAFCTGVGWLLRGSSGAIVALLASSVPCAILATMLTAVFSHWRENALAQAAIHGAVAAAVAITVKTCWTIAKPHYKGAARLRVMLIGAAAFLLHIIGGLPAIQVLLLAAVIGALLPAADSQ
jgi:chromate transporter